MKSTVSCATKVLQFRSLRVPPPSDERQMNEHGRSGSGSHLMFGTRGNAFEKPDAVEEEGEAIMRTMAKLAIAAAMAGGLAVAAAAPAEAHVSIGIGVPGPYHGPGYYGGYYGNTCYDAYGQPYYCGYPAYYGGPYVGFGGRWISWRLPRPRRRVPWWRISRRWISRRPRRRRRSTTNDE